MIAHLSWDGEVELDPRPKVVGKSDIFGFTVTWIPPNMATYKLGGLGVISLES